MKKIIKKTKCLRCNSEVNITLEDYRGGDPVEFEDNIKHFNFIFASSIDLIYEFFKLDNKLDNKYLNYLLKYTGKNKFLHNFLSKYADHGLSI